MNQEIQRIANEITNLQQQILRNELPTILLDLSAHANSQQYTQLLINAIVNIERSQFINAIAQNIANVKTENNKISIQNQQLKKTIKNESYQSARVQETIKDLTHQKNSLYSQLQDLRARQNSLAQMMNSNSIQLKIREILREKQTLKCANEQKDKVIQIKTTQIKAYIEKQIFYTSQIRALQNDNILFHKDLTNANQQILNLKQNNIKIKQNQEKQKQFYQQAIKSLKQQIKNLKTQLNKHKDQKSGEQSLKLQAIKQAQQIIQQRSRQVKRAKDLQQQNGYLRGSLEHMKDQLSLIKTKLQQTAQKYEEQKNNSSCLSCQVKKMEDMIIKINKQNDQKQQLHNNDMNVLTGQILNAQNKYSQLRDQFNSYKQETNKMIAQFKTQSQVKYQQLQKQKEDKIRQIQQEITKINQKRSEQIKQFENANKELHTNIETLEEQLHLQKEHHQQYIGFMDQNNHLKAQIEKLLKKNYEKSTQKITSKKLFFQILQVKQQFQRIKKQNFQLRSLVSTVIQTNRRWALKQIGKLVKFILEMKNECQTCYDWQKQQATMNLNLQFKNKQTNEIKSIKDIKSLNQRYKLIKQKNEKFSNRIQQMIHN